MKKKKTKKKKKERESDSNKMKLKVINIIIELKRWSVELSLVSTYSYITLEYISTILPHNFFFLLLVTNNYLFSNIIQTFYIILLNWFKYIFIF